MYTYIFQYLYSYLYVYISIRISRYECLNIHKYIHKVPVFMSIQTFLYLYIYTWMYSCAYTYIYMHTKYVRQRLERLVLCQRPKLRCCQLSLGQSYRWVRGEDLFSPWNFYDALSSWHLHDKLNLWHINDRLSLWDLEVSFGSWFRRLIKFVKIRRIIQCFRRQIIRMSSWSLKTHRVRDM